MTRMSDKAEQKRARIEDVMAQIAKSRVLLRTQIRLRVRQARDRGRFHELLGPAEAQLSQVEHAIEAARELLGEYWREGERAQWK